MINVGIYNQHKLILQCLENYLLQSTEIKPVFTAFDKESLFEKMVGRIVNILVLNFMEITHNDIDMIISLKMKFPKTSILVVSDSQRDDIVAKTIKSGAKGFLSIDSDASELLQAIYTIRSGHDYYSESITHILLKRYIGSVGASANEKDEYDDDSQSLSSRQIEILKLWGDGLSNQEIADKLFISVRTVETHKNHIMQKLNLKSSVDLIKYAIRNSIIKL
ncbi:MAG: response regulator transcription factor [Bacteroidales bacterium]|nr:response regulator transcription factor [Bacteroidales bacterium]